MHVLPWMHRLSLTLFATFSVTQLLSEKQRVARVDTGSLSIFSHQALATIVRAYANCLSLSMLTAYEIRYFVETMTYIVRLGH